MFDLIQTWVLKSDIDILKAFLDIILLIIWSFWTLKIKLFSCFFSCEGKELQRNVFPLILFVSSHVLLIISCFSVRFCMTMYVLSELFLFILNN